MQALRYYPWTSLIGSQIEERPDEVILSVPVCPVQEARRGFALRLILKVVAQVSNLLVSL